MSTDNPTIGNLQALLANGRDTALLRFSLGSEYLKQGDPAQASGHLQQAVALDPHYSAAWKLLGKACLEAGDRAAARDAWQQGATVAEARGDQQAAREMTVFLRRLQKNAG